MHSIFGPLLSRARRLGYLLVMAPASLLQAQDAQGDTLRLARLFSLVGENSPRLSAARALASASHARVPAAGRPTDPQVQLGLMNYEVPAFRPMETLGMVQLQVMQMVPTRGKLALGKGIASAQAEAASFTAREAFWSEWAKAAMAFHDWLLAHRELELMRDSRGLIETIVKTAESMYAAGGGAQADVLKAQVELARMSQDIVRMEGMRDAMETRLRGILDLPLEQRLGVPAADQWDPLPSLQTLLTIAERRPMLDAGRSQVTAAERSHQLARRERWPDLQVGAQYGQRGGEMGREHMASLMVGASIPVFANDRQKRMQEETAAMLVMAKADLAAMRADTRALLAERHADATRAANLRRTYETTILPQAEAVLEASLAAWRAGNGSMMSVLDARMSRNTWRQEVLKLDAEEGKARADLEMLSGAPLGPRPVREEND